MKKNHKIVCAFPLTGKSWAAKHVEGVDAVDCESSEFGWIYTKNENGESERVRNPEFPANYIAHVKKMHEEHELVFCSTHKEVIEGLVAEGLQFTLVRPHRWLMGEWCKRWDRRAEREGNGFAKGTMRKYWWAWHRSMDAAAEMEIVVEDPSGEVWLAQHYPACTKQIILDPDQHLSDLIDQL